jgi:heme O synthase-like polyprenyltransferase
MAVRVSPVSKTAAILLMALGLFTAVFVNVFVGAVIVVIGVVLYRLLFRFTAKVQRELDEAVGGA